MVELVDTHDLESCAEMHEVSNTSICTKYPYAEIGKQDGLKHHCLMTCRFEFC